MVYLRAPRLPVHLLVLYTFPGLDATCSHWRLYTIAWMSLSAFKGASPALRDHEVELFCHADLVFYRGQSSFKQGSPAPERPRISCAV